MKYLPRKLKYWEGGFFAGYVSIELQGRELVLVNSDTSRPMSPEEEFDNAVCVMPSRQQWVEFKDELERMKIWKWEDNCWAEILDGTQVEIWITFDRTVKIFCSNKYPRNFNKLKKALNQTACEKYPDGYFDIW